MCILIFNGCRVKHCLHLKMYLIYTWYQTAAAAAAAKSLQPCLTLCDPIDGSPPGSLVPGILQARTLEWVAFSFSNAWKWKVKVKSLSCVWFFMAYQDCSPPGSSVHGIFQARGLKRVAIAFSNQIARLYLKFCYFKQHYDKSLYI